LAVHAVEMQNVLEIFATQQ